MGDINNQVYGGVAQLAAAVRLQRASYEGSSPFISTKGNGLTIQVHVLSMLYSLPHLRLAEMAFRQPQPES